MTEPLPSYVGGRWVDGQGDGATLRDPVTGEALVRVSSEGIDLAGAFEYARTIGGRALRDHAGRRPAGARNDRFSRSAATAAQLPWE